MAQFQGDYNTLKQALDDSYKVNQLKSLAKQISKKNPTRKVELVEHITSLVFKNLDTLLADFDPMARHFSE